MYVVGNSYHSSVIRYPLSYLFILLFSGLRRHIFSLRFGCTFFLQLNFQVQYPGLQTIQRWIINSVTFVMYVIYRPFSVSFQNKTKKKSHKGR
jgi:hypothetical protein